LPAYVAHVADSSVASALIDILREKTNRFDRYWALSALLIGWGRDHPQIAPCIDTLADAADEDLRDLVSLLPEIILDKSAARQRLIRMGKDSEVRRDLLIIGLEACNCDSADNEAVAAIFAAPSKLTGAFDGAYALFRAFGSHADVRALALKRLREAEAPLLLTCATWCCAALTCRFAFASA
jgi:hypothetical protein